MPFWRALLVLIGLALVTFGASILEPDWVTTAGQRPVEIATLPCSTALQSTSSGFAIDDRTVVTVAHAIHGSQDVAVRDTFGVWHRDPQVLVLDLERDLAVLHVEGLRATPMSVAPTRPTVDWMNEPLRMLDGSASGTARAQVLRRVSIVAEVVGNRDETARRSGYEVSLDIGPGDSGAALVDDTDRLVGIVFAQSKRREAITWATAADQLSIEPGEISTWDCDPTFDAELELRPRTPARLAG